MMITHILILLLSVAKTAAHAGHEHVFTGESYCHGAIIPGVWTADNTFLFADWNDATVYEYRTRDRGYTAIHQFEQGKPLAIAELDGNVLLLNDDMTIYTNFLNNLQNTDLVANGIYQCLGNRIRTSETHLYTMSAATGTICQFDLAANTLTLVHEYTSPWPAHMLWPDDGVAYIAFDLIHENNTVVGFAYYWNRDPKVITTVGLAYNNGTRKDLFPDGIYHAQPNHNKQHGGGDVLVRDHLVYVFTGEGDNPDIPPPHPQDPTNLNGKVITVPLDAHNAPEHTITAVGLRHPWSVAVDPHSGNIFVGDVGRNLYEEITLLPPDSYQTGRINFGWPGAFLPRLRRESSSTKVTNIPYPCPIALAQSGCAIGSQSSRPTSQSPHTHNASTPPTTSSSNPSSQASTHAIYATDRRDSTLHKTSPYPSQCLPASPSPSSPSLP